MPLQSSSGQKIARVVDNFQPGPSTVATIFLFPLGVSAFSICFFLSLSYTFFLYGVGFLEFSSFGLPLAKHFGTGKDVKTHMEEKRIVRLELMMFIGLQAVWTVCA